MEKRPIRELQSEAMAVMKNINGSLSHMQTELSTLAREEETTDDNLCSLEESLLAHEETIVFLRQEAIAAKQLTNRPQIEVREERHRHRAQEQTEDWPKQRSKSQTFEESDHGSCALNPAASDVDRSHEANSIDEVQQDNEEIEEHSPKRNRKRERQRLRRQRKRALNRESKVELSSDPVEEDAISIGANLVQAYHESPKPETTKALMDHLYASIDQIHVRDPHINSSNLMARLAHYYDHVRQAADSTLPWKDLESYSQNIWYLLKALEGSSFDLTQDTFRRDFEYLRWVWSLVAHIEVRELFFISN